MGFDAYVTIAVVVIAFVLFATEYFTVDHIAISIIAVLVISGVLTPEEGVDGFANMATITVAAMFILSNCLIQISKFFYGIHFFKPVILFIITNIQCGHKAISPLHIFKTFEKSHIC